MSRRSRILKIIGGSVLGLIVLVLIAAFITVQTAWFRNFVRTKIIAVTEESTGGRVELAAFDFDWRTFRATMRGFVIHGTEPPGAAPFVRTEQVQVELKLFAGLKKAVDLRSLTIDRPEVNLIVNADGTTNVPAPKVQKKASDKSGLETVVELAIGRFELRNGLAVVSENKTPFNARGNNVSAQLFYNLLNPRYEGRLSIYPLNVTYANNQPLDLNITVPVAIEKDRVQVTDGKIGTQNSELIINASLEDMKSLKTTARVNGHISLLEAQRFGNIPLSKDAGTKLPGTVDIDAAITMDENTIDVKSARLRLGSSNLEASGLLKDPNGRGALNFKTTLALGEAGQLFQVAAAPQGIVQAEGKAQLRGSEYLVDGNINAKNVSVRQGTTRIQNVGLASSFHIDPHNINLNAMRLTAFGGEFSGNAAISEMERFRLDGRLANLDIQNAAAVFAGERLPYDGRVSGPIKAEGNLKAPGLTGVNANVQLAIAPGRRGTPVSGRLNAVYSGATDSVQVSNSYVTLPNTRLELNGALGRQLQVSLTSKNLNDFLPAIAMGSKNPPKQMPVVLRGPATLNATLTGSLSNPRIVGQLSMANFLVEGRRFDKLTANLNASRTSASVQNLLLTRGGMQTQLNANVGLRNWKPVPQSPLKVAASVTNGDLADIVVLAGKSDVPASGALSASADIGGTFGNPSGSAVVSVANGSLYQEAFDKLDARVNFSDQLVTIPGVVLSSGPARVELTGRFEHPRESFTTGRIQLSLNSNDVQLARLQNVAKQRPGIAGVLQLKADVAGNLTEKAGETSFLLSSVNADFGVRGLKDERQNYGDLTGNARTSGSTVSYRVDSNFAKSTLRVNGQTRLEPQYPTSASASLSDLPIESVLALARRGDVPARGLLSGSASVSGTMDKLSADADLALTRAVIYEEPVDKIQTRLTYSPVAIDLQRLEIAAGPSTIAMSANYTHPENDLMNGQLRFRVADSSVQLGNLKNVQRLRPGLSGSLRMIADGAGTVSKRAGSDAQIRLRSLNADVGTNALRVNGNDLGNLKLAAQTKGDTLDFTLNSDLARSAIQGSGRAVLNGDYPLNAQLKFGNITYGGIRPFLAGGSGPPSNWDALVEGQVQVSGPAMRPEAMKGTLELAQVQVKANTQPASGTKSMTIQNQGPVVIALDQSVIRVQSAHLVGPQTDINITGTAPIRGTAPMNLSVNANANLGVIQELSRDIYSSGAVVLQAAVRGTMAKPLVNGRLELKNASLNMIDVPNGISNANGLIVFNGNNATIQQLTAETGGGKLTLAGFVAAPNGVLTYNLRANGKDVRVRYPEGFSIVASTNISLTGNINRSLLSGNVTVESLGFSPRQDFGSMLSRTSAPVESPGAPQGALAGMRLDVRIRTAPSIAFQTSLAQNLQADADLNLRGTLASPGLVGRVNITEGQLVFFGSQYTVNQGTIAFYSPIRIQPILNVDLQTVAKGVTVNLNVSGPIDNMKLTHTSDPPLQFTEVVALLATGKTPTSDPNIVAREPATPPQSLQQMGGSALLSQAVANPVANRLERVFGISRLKIDPTFTSGSELPQARLTLQQQVTSNITFTYVTNVAQTNSQIVRVEWALNDTWSALATREENGRFGVDFFYKRQFR